MAASKLNPSAQLTEIEDPDSDSNDTSCVSDDSDEDPTFDVINETSSRLSKISITKPRKVKPVDLESDDFEESHRVEIPELNEKDGKSFEKVEELIKDGQLEKLKVEQCKLYLRKYGLRLTGNKGILIERIKLHLEVINGEGEKKYPPSSFVLNCKGDACTGDIVMFEQKVYEMYNIASRSATGPPCGTRVVAGRIVKESYGTAKQQHTFTIEVLWSTGEKPLPPLHPLLIKGRNLYRLGTMRQRWDDEEERRKVIQEKHSRGNHARSTREVRIKEKESRKLGNAKRTVSQTNQEKSETSKPETKPDFKSKHPIYPAYLPSYLSSPASNTVLQQNSSRLFQNHHIYPAFTQQHHTQHQPCTATANPTTHTHQYHSSNYGQNENLHPMHHGQFSHSNEHNNNSGYNHSRHHQGRHGPTGQRGPPRQWCRYYRQGICHYGDACKFLHE